ncbi:uncharacterized protein LOC129565300 [Sitodiplosis mosellana]|uniref:uncharacterized protein LOC129565300 n=1 Tax=Sitodiplosis mosellana TaxID=263140 RepID=UPI00244380F0|nr:uncharacterized protein LOC129565300 [Sitodiplosis mosellana]
MASDNPSFLDDLSEWLMCTFCAETFSRQKQFLFLFCSKVACIDCALKMRSRSEPKKIDCGLCKKTVGLYQIRNEMPPQLRKLFQNTEKMIEEAMNIYEFQQRLTSMALENLEKNIDEMESDISDMVYRAEQDDRMAQRDEADAGRYSGELLKIMTDEQLQYLETDSAEQLQQMNFDQIVGSGPRRRLSRTTSSPSSRYSRSPHSTPESMSASSHGGLTQMMNDMVMNQRIDQRRRQSRSDLRRHSREGTPQKIRHRQDSRSRGSRHSRDGRRSHGSGSGSGSSPHHSHEPRKRSSRDGFPNLH